MQKFLKKNILFITQSDNSGSDVVLIKAAEFLVEEGHSVQVLVAKKTTHNPLVLELKPNKELELGDVISPEGKINTLERDLKYLFVTINEHEETHNINHILKHLRFNPDFILVGSNPLFLKVKDIANLAEVTEAIVYNVCLDMSHLTGGCHFAWDCKGYIESGCKKCPAIKNEDEKYIAERNFRIKKELREKYNFRILAGTEWTKKQARQSLLYKNQDIISNISGIIDPEIYFPEHRDAAKKVFNLDRNKFYILSGSENSFDERKGYQYFIEALNILWESLSDKVRENVVILSVGKNNQDQNHSIPFVKKHIDYIKDDRFLAQLYKAADVFINSSIEDSGPAMLLESLACGTPVVAFAMGAAPEFIEDGYSGFIIPNKNSSALAEGIKKVVQLSKQKRQKFGVRGSKKVMEIGSKNSFLSKMNQLFDYHYQYIELRRTIEMSVALCTYNGEKYLKEQLDSILNQNLAVNEIIICDDGSTDKTWEIITMYQENYPNLIKGYKNLTNLGVVKNFEKAINLCKKEIVFLSDQDDIWYPQKTEHVISAFKMSGKNAICHDLQLCNQDKTPINHRMWETLGFSAYIEKHQTYRPITYALFCGNMVTGASFAFRKKNSVELIEGYHTVIHDYQLALKYLKKDDVFFLYEPLGLYRQHENQQIGTSTDKIKLHKKMVDDFYSNDNLYDKFKFMKNREKSERIFQFIDKNEGKNMILKLYKYILQYHFYSKSRKQQIRILMSFLRKADHTLLFKLIQIKKRL